MRSLRRFAPRDDTLGTYCWKWHLSKALHSNRPLVRTAVPTQMMFA